MAIQLFLLAREINAESGFPSFKSLRRLFLLLSCWPFVNALAFEAQVVDVLSGDTVVVEERGTGKRTKVRLLAADAPEEHQPGYKRSKRALAKLVKSRSVIVEPASRQICSKLNEGCVALGRIWSASEDVALRLIRVGLVWHDVRQVPDQSTADRSLYRDAANNAIREKKGLWAKARPVPPWEFKPPALPRSIASKKRKPRK